MAEGDVMLDKPSLRKFAMLMQIHRFTSAKMIARRHGVSAEYVRRQLRDMPVSSVDLVDVLNELADQLLQKTQHLSPRSGSYSPANGKTHL